MMRRHEVEGLAEEQIRWLYQFNDTSSRRGVGMWEAIMMVDERGPC